MLIYDDFELLRELIFTTCRVRKRVCATKRDFSRIDTPLKPKPLFLGVGHPFEGPKRSLFLPFSGVGFRASFSSHLCGFWEHFDLPGGTLEAPISPSLTPGPPLGPPLGPRGASWGFPGPHQSPRVLQDTQKIAENCIRDTKTGPRASFQSPKSPLDPQKHRDSFGKTHVCGKSHFLLPGALSGAKKPSQMSSKNELQININQHKTRAR